MLLGFLHVFVGNTTSDGAVAIECRWHLRFELAKEEASIGRYDLPGRVVGLRPFISLPPGVSPTYPMMEAAPSPVRNTAISRAAHPRKLPSLGTGTLPRFLIYPHTQLMRRGRLRAVRVVPVDKLLA